MSEAAQVPDHDQLWPTRSISTATPDQSIPFRNKSRAKWSGHDTGGEKQGPHDIQMVQRAYDYLGKMIGYKNHRVDMSKMRIILGDTLTAIEKLKFGFALTPRPREMDEASIVRKMAELVPKDGVDMTGINKIRAVGGRLAVRAAKVIILANYIQGLQKTRMQQSRQTGVVSLSVVFSKQPIGQVSVEQTLQKIEIWCDAWLRGDLTGGDWNNFGGCLDRKEGWNISSE